MKITDQMWRNVGWSEGLERTASEGGPYKRKKRVKKKYAACSRKAPASEAAATQAVPDLLLFEFDLAYAAFYGQVQGVGGFAVGRVYVLAVFFLQAVNIDRA